MTGNRVAVVLFNLGGPDRPSAIRPFLLNLFRDPAILRVPFFVRPLLARIITWARLKPARRNYALLGGKSPLLELTKAQAKALEHALAGQIEAKCFIAMRYWRPFSEQTARQVATWRPDEVVLLPLYPQYSTTTTGSSLSAWRDAAAKAGLVAPVTSICCYYADKGFLDATAKRLKAAWTEARAKLAPDIPLRLLFSAHGLPDFIVKAGDPYQFQIERMADTLARALDIAALDSVVCYQSRATPQKWIGPSTEEEIARAGRDGVAVLVCPLAFVSEHSETLVELDVEYRELARKRGVRGYFRAPTQNDDPDFIAALAQLVLRARQFGPGLCSSVGGRTCPSPYGDCPHAQSDPRERRS